MNNLIGQLLCLFGSHDMSGVYKPYGDRENIRVRQCVRCGFFNWR